MKVIVLGGGLIGVTTAYYLAKDGQEVAVVDRQPGVALETSFANAGLVSPGHSYTWASPSAPVSLIRSLYRDDQALRLKLVPDWRMYAWCWHFIRNCTDERARANTTLKLRLSRYSQAELRQLTEQEALTYDQTNKGLLYLYRDQASFDAGIANTSVLKEGGLVLMPLDRAATCAKEPALVASGSTIAGSIYCPSDGSGDAHHFATELFARCIRLGVTFQPSCEILGLSGNADSVDHIHTSLGPMKADAFVLALGSYSSVLARTLGYVLPVYPVKGYSVTLPLADRTQVPDIGGVDEGNLVAWSRLGDRMRITGTAEFAGYNRRHRPSDFVHMLRSARELFPHGPDYSRPTYWAGLRPMTPSGTPYIGQTRHRNLYFNTGHGHLGWTWSCGTARLVADIIQGRVPAIDISGLTLATKKWP
jgi:D-amino-acid dehydrogenase